METITAFMTEHSDVIVSILAFLIAHLLASFTTATTETRATWWYKVIEILALAVNKAKDKTDGNS